MGELDRGATFTVEQMRDAVMSLVRGVNAGDPRELAKELFRDDGDFSQELIQAYPRLVSAAAQAVKAFAESMEGMPPEAGAELVASSYARVDGGEIAEAVNAMSRLIIRLHEENPQLFTRGKTTVVSDTIKGVDFGKLRKAIIYRAGEELGSLRGDLESLGENPVALVNLFSVVAPITNGALEVLKALFAILALPAEAMTYALFKILEDIDWREFAAVVNGAAGLIVTLHRGNLILGDGSPHSREPADRISSDLVGSLDGEVIAEAVAALGEEGEVFAVAFIDRILENEDLAVPLAESAVLLSNSVFRTTAVALEKANGLSPQALERIAETLAEDLEAGELGRALGALVSLNRRLSGANPELHARLRSQIISSSGLDLSQALSPGALAAQANRAVASYNRWAAENPGQMAEGLNGFLSALDIREFDRAAVTTRAQLAEVVTRHPEVMKALAKTVFSMLYGSAKGYLMSLRGRRGRREV